MLNGSVMECWFLHLGKKHFSIFEKFVNIVLGVEGRKMETLK